mmetsp:Transcript_9680/g.33000  ORF Transcript_9680/g.33000 Transcript_9680/m.33000 type:complete len:88 (+) Transcript_9680:1629-1892(+)
MKYHDGFAYPELSQAMVQEANEYRLAEMRVQQKNIKKKKRAAKTPRRTGQPGSMKGSSMEGGSDKDSSVSGWVRRKETRDDASETKL